MRPPGLLDGQGGQVSHLAQLRKAEIGRMNRAERATLDTQLAQTEHFVFTAIPDCDDEVQASAKAMEEAEVWRLPFPVCTFEFVAEISLTNHPSGREVKPTPGRADHFIMVLTDNGSGPQIEAVFCRANKHHWIRIDDGGENWRRSGGHPAEKAMNNETMAWARGFKEGARDAMAELEVSTGHGHSHPIWIGATCLVMLATKGIRRERWIGNQAVLRNRPEPRDAYTKVMVREAYDWQGKTGHREPGHSETGEPRYRVRLHLRRGHIRNQPFGPRSQGLSTQIWIQPMLVGYAEEGTVEHTHYEQRPKQTALDRRISR
jgi:hypothetical protein